MRPTEPSVTAESYDEAGERVCAIKIGTVIREVAACTS